MPTFLHSKTNHIHKRKKWLQVSSLLNALATALQTDKSIKLFWQKVKRTKTSSPLPISVDNATGTIDVADHWRSHN